jgi:hypothetical protein
LLAILPAVAACSTRHDSEAADILSQDPALSARLEMPQNARELRVPDVCGATAGAAQPTAADKRQAEKLIRQAYHAEVLGNVPVARSLLHRASELDGTDKSAAYHLGRTSEALGDRPGAMTAYCRYLALTTTPAESVEARQRVAQLSESGTRPAAEVSHAAPTGGRARATAGRVPRQQRTVERRVVRTTGNRSARATSPEVDGRAARTAAGGEVVATSPRVPTVDEPSTVSRTESRGPSRAQGASIGAVAGAIIGAVTGRSVKDAVIGAAAGGILGTVVGGGSRPVGRGIRPWASATQQAAGSRSVRLFNRTAPAA